MQEQPIGLYIQGLPRRNEHVFKTEEKTQAEVRTTAALKAKIQPKPACVGASTLRKTLFI